MTTFTEKEDGIVYVTIDDSRENDTTGKYLSGPKVKQLLIEGKHDVLQQHFPEHIYKALVRQYEVYKTRMAQFVRKQPTPPKITKESRIQSLRDKLSKRTGKN